MRNELEQALAQGGPDFPSPTKEATSTALAAFLAECQRRAPSRVQRLILGRRMSVRLVVALVVFAAFGGGAFAAATTLFDHGPANPAGTAGAAPGFLPARGWNVIQSGLTPPPGAITAVAANVPFAPGDKPLIEPPSDTINNLGPNGVLLDASFGATPPGHYPTRSLPLHLSDASAGSMEGFPQPGKTLRLIAWDGGYEIDVLIIFGSANPTPETTSAAAEELTRLAVPSCPANAQALSTTDLASAKAFVNRWLVANYSASSADLDGTHVEVTPLTSAQAGLRDQATTACGSGALETMAEVDVAYSAAAQRNTGAPSASYLIYRSGDTWTIWQPAGG